MINFDGYTYENKTERNPNGRMAIREWLLLGALDQEKQMNY